MSWCRRLKIVCQAAGRVWPAMCQVCRLWRSHCNASGDNHSRGLVDTASGVPVVVPSLWSPLKLWWQQQTDTLQGRAPVGAKRSSEWPDVAAAHLAANPVCECCGGKDKLRVHHIQPFFLRPDLELEPSNLLTLCESKRYGINCHLLIGHLGNWRRWNPLAIVDANRWNRRLDPDWFRKTFEAEGSSEI